MIEFQLAQFFAAVYGGLVIGALYLFFLPFRRLARRRWIINLLDGLYYVAAAVAAALTLLLVSGGVPRFFALFGIGLGAYLFIRFPYRLFLGRK